MGYKVKKRFIGVQQVRPGETVQTFDFQNDGQLGWTMNSDTTRPLNMGYTSGQGFYGSKGSAYNGAGAIIPPSSFFGKGDLKHVELYYYKPGASWGGSINGERYGGEWDATSYIKIGTNKNAVNVGNINGEIILKFDYDGDYCIGGSINGTSFSGNFPSTCPSEYKNNSLAVGMTTWGSSGTMYIRKLIIITKN